MQIVLLVLDEHTRGVQLISIGGRRTHQGLRRIQSGCANHVRTAGESLDTPVGEVGALIKT